MIARSPDMICIIDRDGCLVSVSDACKSLLGYEKNELGGRAFIDLVHPHDRAYTLKIQQDLIRGFEIGYFENRCIQKSGKEISLQWSVSWSEEDEAFFCTARDGRAPSQCRGNLVKKEELQRILLEHGSDLLALVDEELNFMYTGGAALKEFGYQMEELIGSNATKLVHPEDLPLVFETLTKVMVSANRIKVPKFRFRNGFGEWRWIKATAWNQLEAPSIRAIIVSALDITERENAKLQRKEGQRRHKVLMESSPDLVLYEDKNGIIKEASSSATCYFGQEKEKIINRSLYDFLPSDVLLINSATRKDAILGRKVNYNLEIAFAGSGPRLFDIAKIPVKERHEVTGVLTVAKDVTLAAHAHRLVKQQAKKLTTVFESLTDGFFTLDRNWNFTYINSEFDRLLHTKREEMLGKNIREVFPKEYGRAFYEQFQKAMESGKAVHFTYYVEKYRQWLEIKAFPSEEGLAVYLEDVTERIQSRQELEKLSLVASKTSNGVVITDAAGRVEWVNEAFTKLTGYRLSEVQGKLPGSLLQGEETDKATAQRIIAKRNKGQPFSEEILNYKKSGEKVWLLLDVTPVRNEAGEIVKFIFIQTDITYRKNAEKSQLQMTADLYRQNQDLQQFTYIVSHNIRGPVANMMGLVDLLGTKGQDPEIYPVYLGYLKDSIHRLDAVLKDLNVVLGVRDRKDTFQQRINLSFVCGQAIKNLEDPLQDCDGEVIMEVGDDVWVRGSKAYLYSIFYNLLSNSIKYRSPDRKLKIFIRNLGQTDRGTKISFSDNGLGLEMDKVGEHIFKLYKRFHQPAGRGFGLFLVKTQVEAMGGHIEVSSQLDVGTDFFIYLK